MEIMGYNEIEDWMPDESKDNKVVNFTTSHDKEVDSQGKRFDKSQKTTLMEHVDWTLKNKIDTDLDIKIGERVFNCHLVVLKCFSNFFIQQTHGAKLEVNTKNISPQTFDTLYNWMLRPDDQMEEMLNVKNILNMLIASQYFSIPMLKEQCWRYIQFLEDGPALSVYIEAGVRGIRTVGDFLLPTVGKVFLPLAKSDLYDRLPLHIVSELLSSNHICVHSEVEVFVAACKWLKHDWENRREHFVDLMRCVRFGHMALWQLYSIRRNSATKEFQAQPGGVEIDNMIQEGMAHAQLLCSRGEVSSEDLTALPSRKWIGPEESYSSIEQLSRDDDREDKRASGDREAEVDDLEAKMGLLSISTGESDSSSSKDVLLRS